MGLVIFGIIGYPLAYSGSGVWFSERFKSEGKDSYIYQNFPLSSLDEFPPLFRKHPAIKGLNVTIPYKKQIIPWLEELDPKADKIGAVNTILVKREKGNIHLKGFNTDAEGFHRSANFSGHRKALILGTGGAAKAVAYALSRMGISFLFVSRSERSSDCISYEMLTEDVVSSHTLIVNATPLGMFPDEESFPPIPYHFLTNDHFLYDLVYYPRLTNFLKKAALAGAKIQNGLKMLEIQAELSYRIWNMHEI
ncbi:MAG: shikimate dehydrogenase [Bacteroidales bacterium]|jgi:shikimate dehydrogenase